MKKIKVGIVLFIFLFIIGSIGNLYALDLGGTSWHVEETIRSQSSGKVYKNIFRVTFKNNGDCEVISEYSDMQNAAIGKKTYTKWEIRSNTLFIYLPNSRNPRFTININTKTNGNFIGYGMNKNIKVTMHK